MSTEIFPGQIVTWTAEGQTYAGRVMHTFPTTDLNKGAGEPEEVARIRLIADGQDLDHVRFVPTTALEPYAPTTVLNKNASDPRQMDQILAQLSESERNAVALSWFRTHGLKLPTQIVGEEGPRPSLQGVDRVMGGAPA